MSKYYGTDDGLWSDGQNFRPYRDTPGSDDRWTEVECPNCGDDVEVRNTAEDQQARCRECHRLFTVWYDAECVDGRWRGTHHLREIPERTWNPNDRGYEPPRGTE